MYEGWTVPVDYDPLLAKVIGYGTDREQAIGRLIRALNEYFVGGIKTNLSLFQRILNDPDFRAAKVDTGYLERLLARPARLPDEDGKAGMDVAAIAAGLFALLNPQNAVPSNGSPTPGSSVGGRNSEGHSEWKRTGRQESLR